MRNKKIGFESLSLLSGKGGSGKTVIALSMCKVLKEAGVKVLLVDCDIATHGATYFFESELESKKGQIISMSQLLQGKTVSGAPLVTRAGFHFIPSTLTPAEIEEDSTLDPALNIRNNLINLDNLLKNRMRDYNVVIFDCQAGYSPLTKWVAKVSKHNLIVLEADAVSSTALRVLYLQIGKVLSTYRTWQVFNKLSEEERATYEKVFGGTFFPNLPPIPFDWQVKASFATCEIPSVMSKGSAFGLGVLRLMQTVFPKSSEQLRDLENKTVGEWFEDITTRLNELEDKRNKIKSRKMESERQKRLYRNTLMMSFMLLPALLYFISRLSGFLVFDELKFVGPLFVGMLTSVAIAWYSFTIFQIRVERKQDAAQEELTKLEGEIEKFRTLVATDPRLREYSRERNAKAHRKSAEKERMSLEEARQIEQLRHNPFAGYLMTRFDVGPDTVHAAVTDARSIRDFGRKLGELTGREEVGREVVALFKRYTDKKGDLNELRRKFGLSRLE